MLVLDKLYVFQWDTPISPLFMVMISFATKIMSLYTSISIIDNQTYLTMLFKMGTFQRHRKSLEWWPFHSGTLFCEDLVIFFPWWETSLLLEPSLICLTPMGTPWLRRSKFSSWEARTTYFEAVHYLFKGREREFNSVTSIFHCRSGWSAQFKSKFCNSR